MYTKEWFSNSPDSFVTIESHWRVSRQDCITDSELCDISIERMSCIDILYKIVVTITMF